MPDESRSDTAWADSDKPVSAREISEMRVDLMIIIVPAWMVVPGFNLEQSIACLLAWP